MQIQLKTNDKKRCFGVMVTPLSIFICTCYLSVYITYAAIYRMGNQIAKKITVTGHSRFSDWHRLGMPNTTVKELEKSEIPIEQRYNMSHKIRKTALLNSLVLNLRIKLFSDCKPFKNGES